MDDPLCPDPVPAVSATNSHSSWLRASLGHCYQLCLPRGCVHMEWPSSDKGIVSEGELVCFKQGPRWARASSSTGDQHLPPPPPQAQPRAVWKLQAVHRSYWRWKIIYTLGYICRGSVLESYHRFSRDQKPIAHELDFVHGLFLNRT